MTTTLAEIGPPQQARDVKKKKKKKSLLLTSMRDLAAMKQPL